MLSQKASEWDLDIDFLDKDKSFPAGLINRKFTEGSFNNYDDVMNFAQGKDVITIEIENVNADALKQIESQGIKVIPSSTVINTIKDKGEQKLFYKTHNLPTSEFNLYDSRNEILEAIEAGEINIPFVQKSRTAGYDGKGVLLVKDEASLKQIMDTPSVVEKLVDIDKEVAIIASRNDNGEIAFYDPVEMVFDDRANLLDYLLCPAQISEGQAQNIKQLTKRIIEELNFTGLLAVEFFIDNNGAVIINEMAPRTHNSGHHSIDACYCSQFEMQLRALLNLEPGNTSMKYKFAGIVNLVGEATTKIGSPTYPGLDLVLEREGIYPHIYGKLQVKPYRKMGHVTVVADSKEILEEKINFIKKHLKAIS